MIKTPIGKLGKICITFDFDVLFKWKESISFTDILYGDHLHNYRVKHAPVDIRKLKHRTLERYNNPPADPATQESYLYERNRSFLENLIPHPATRDYAARDLIHQKMETRNWKPWEGVSRFLRSLGSEDWPWEETVIFTTMVDEGLISAFNHEEFFEFYDISILPRSNGRNFRWPSINAVLPVSNRFTPMGSRIKTVEATLEKLRDDHEDYIHLYVTKQWIPIVSITANKGKMGHVVTVEPRHPNKNRSAHPDNAETTYTRHHKILKQPSNAYFWGKTGCSPEPPAELRNISTVSSLQALKTWRPEFSDESELVFVRENIPSKLGRRKG